MAGGTGHVPDGDGSDLYEVIEEDKVQTLKIRIEQENIDQAVKRDSHRCMIADAIQAQIGWAKYIIVDLQSVRFSDTERGKRLVYLTPPRAQQALLEFDRGRKPKPFTMTLNKGFTRTMRVREPGYTPKRRNRKTEKRTKRYMPSRFRKFGLRQYVEAKATRASV